MCWEINLVSLEALQHHKCFFYFVNVEAGRTHKENPFMSNWVFLSFLECLVLFYYKFISYFITHLSNVIYTSGYLS